MKKLSIRLFLLLATLGFAFTVVSCKKNTVGLQLDFEQNNYELVVGEDVILMPKATNGKIADLYLEWESSDESVVKCLNGDVSAEGVGTAIIRVWVIGREYISASTQITVVESDPKGMPVATFEVEGPAGLEGNLYVGDENKLVYELSHEYPDAEMVFSSSNENVATIDAEGNIVALAKGQVTLTAKIVNKNNPNIYVDYNFNYTVKNFNNITFELYGGEFEEEADTEFRTEDEVIVLPTPVKEGYNFLGWYGNKNFAGEAVKEVAPESGHDYLFYAKWEIAEYTITYLHEDGSVAAEEEKYTILDEIELPALTKADWRFLGWAVLDAEGNESEEYITVIEEGTTGDVTLVAKFGQFIIRVAETFDTSKDYKLGLYQGSKKQTLYMTGSLSGYYGATTQDFAKGATLNLVEVEGGYNLKLTLTNGTVKYIDLVKSGTYNNIKFNNSASTVWQYNEEYNTFTTKLGSDTLYLGTYSSYTTFSASVISFAKTSYVSHLYEEVLVTDEIRAEMALEEVEVAESLKEDYELPEYENVTWELAEEYENAKIEDGVLKVTRPENGSGDAVIKLIAKCTINESSATKEFEIVILEDVAYEIVEVTEYETEKLYKMGLYQGNISKQLYATGKMSGYYGATTEKFEDAVDVQLIETEGGYYIQVLNGATPQYLNIVASGSYTNYKYENTAKSVWVLNEKYNTFTTLVGSTEYYAGAYKQFNTLSASKVSYLSSAGNFPIHFYEKVAAAPTIVEESMSVAANKGVLSGKTISWTGTNFTLKNEQHNSSSAIRTSDTNHFRCYQGSKTTISGNDGVKVSKVVITSTGSSYATALVSSINANLYTVEVNDLVITITPKDGAVDSIEIVAAKQWRLNNILVFCEK